jgi:hypothetical protein
MSYLDRFRAKYGPPPPEGPDKTDETPAREIGDSPGGALTELTKPGSVSSVGTPTAGAAESPTAEPLLRPGARPRRRRRHRCKTCRPGKPCRVCEELAREGYFAAGHCRLPGSLPWRPRRPRRGDTGARPDA